MFAADIKATVLPVAVAQPPVTRVSWKEIAEPVEPFLDIVASQLAKQVRAFEPELATYAQYALTNQGKQLRPALVALSGGAAGKINNDLVTIAVIIEMVHLATLVHDDVMDSAEIRRRRPTLAANWGNEISVLLGDCLFAHALKLAASFPTTEVCRAVASATNTVCTGEILQTQRRGNLGMSRAEYFKVLRMKTAELFALSCDLGASLGGANEAGRSALRQYGMALGTAYQLYDDCLDLIGSESLAGKSLGTDLANGKITLPVLVCLERANQADRAKLADLFQSWTRSALGPMLELLEKYGAMAEARSVIHQFISAARQCLECLPENESRAALADLTDFLAQQTVILGVAS